MTTFVEPIERGSGAAAFDFLRSGGALTLAFSNAAGVEQPVGRVQAGLKSWMIFEGPTPQLLYKQRIDLASEDEAIVRKVWLLKGDTVLAFANLRADVLVAPALPVAIAELTILLTLAP